MGVCLIYACGFCFDVGFFLFCFGFGFGFLFFLLASSLEKFLVVVVLGLWRLHQAFVVP